MEAKDIQLIKKHIAENPDLKRLWDEHLEFERKLVDLESHQPPTDESHFEIEKIKKLKLKGKDQIARILTRYR
jgi:uncharacterized protein